MLYVCKLEYCPENVRYTDILKVPEIYVISGVISFGNPFGNLCSEKHRFADNQVAALAFILRFTKRNFLLNVKLCYSVCQTMKRDSIFSL